MVKPNPTPPCKSCGEKFFKPHKRAIYCSLRCAFLPFVAMRGKEECWHWTKAKNDKGYGHGSYLNRVVYAHRAMFEVFKGAIPDKSVIRHSCDNPPCCNPDHLELGTQVENAADMDHRGRRRTVYRTGSQHIRAKLTDVQVAEIRCLQGVIGSPTVAKKYGVSKTSILRIWNGRSWNKPSGVHIILPNQSL